MKKKIRALFLVAFACALCAALAACAPSKEGTSASTVEYADDSLIAYHEAMGKDIANLGEVSVDACGTCHGDLAEIQSDTEDVLVSGSLKANPHVNHMFKEYECSDCHSLTEASALSCDETCHEWDMTRDNGTWGSVA